MMSGRVSFAALAAVLAGCTRPSPPAEGAGEAEPPACAEPATADALATITLREDAERALGVEVAKAERVEAADTLVAGGDVMVPAGRDVALAAPVGGRIRGAAHGLPKPGDHVAAGQPLLTLVPLATVDRDVRARAQRDLDAAKADLELADARLKRAETMMNDRSGSVRAFEEARAQQKVAQAAVGSAESRVRTLAGGSLDSDVALPVKSPVDGVVRAVRVIAGQSVPQGVPLVEIASDGRWIRATFASSDGERLLGLREAFATRLGSAARVALVPAQGPPSADPARGTIDRFFAMPAGADWTPGERVLVEVVTAGAPPSERIAVPFAAVVRDAEGGAWVYERVAPRTYRRRRVDPLRRDGERMLLRAGIAEGAEIVGAGAVELWGHEMGADL